MVKLSAVLGWVSDPGQNTLRVTIYRNNPSSAGGILIFSTLDATDSNGAFGTTSIVTVDDPPTTGVVNYFLEVSMDDGDANLIGPVTFIGEVIRP